MAVKMTITNNKHTVECVYPQGDLTNMFMLLDNHYKWLLSGARYTLSKEDQKEIAADIDSAINNISNLDMA